MLTIAQELAREGYSLKVFYLPPYLVMQIRKQSLMLPCANGLASNCAVSLFASLP